MYRGVVKVSDPVPVLQGDDGPAAIPPSSPIEKEISRTVALLRGQDTDESSVPTMSYRKDMSTQTESKSWLDAEIPNGYGVPRIFIRSVAEAIEQGVLVYSPLIREVEDRERGVLRVLQEVSQFFQIPRHLFFESFETSPVWYDYCKIIIMDTVTAEILGSADIFPPNSKALLLNVNVPLYESVIVNDDSVPHLAQVEVSFLTFDNKIVGQTVCVPLELFVRGSSIVAMLDDSTQREISYKAVLVRKELLEEIDEKIIYGK